ncbi:hypothetical protein HDC92_002249 [Pedobacter sp. AK017]|uniref:hypothetical protein n=1 Tax=Pedobacter sp. AK017 TaxID=2723073 RepID=UPI0016076885|nr:hypothetical protein [Pedobacter sp. AK017]MBB5438573.1 hypothetical protein [Pedobacter sp. AK017]
MEKRHRNQLRERFPLITDKHVKYNRAVTRYEEIKRVQKGSNEHKEKLLLAHLISEYENEKSE